MIQQPKDDAYYTYVATVPKNPQCRVNIHRIAHKQFLDEYEHFPKDERGSAAKTHLIRPSFSYTMSKAVNSILALRFLSDSICVALVRSAGEANLVGLNYAASISSETPATNGSLEIKPDRWRLIHAFPDREGFKPISLDVREGRDGERAFVLVDHGGKGYRILRGNVTTKDDGELDVR